MKREALKAANERDERNVRDAAVVRQEPSEPHGHDPVRRLSHDGDDEEDGVEWARTTPLSADRVDRMRGDTRRSPGAVVYAVLGRAAI